DRIDGQLDSVAHRHTVKCRLTGDRVQLADGQVRGPPGRRRAQRSGPESEAGERDACALHGASPHEVSWLPGGGGPPAQRTADIVAWHARAAVWYTTARPCSRSTRTAFDLSRHGGKRRFSERTFAVDNTLRWPHRPAGSTWGDFGPDDQLGRLNLVTPRRVRVAVSEVQEGGTFCRIPAVQS